MFRTKHESTLTPPCLHIRKLYAINTWAREKLMEISTSNILLTTVESSNWKITPNNLLFFAVENGKYGNFMLILYAHRYSMYKYKWICFIIAFDGGIWISNVFMRFSTRHSRPINRAWFLQRIHLQIPRSCQNTNAILCVRKDISFMEILTHNLSLCYAYIWTTYHFKKDMLHYFYRKKRAKNALTQCKKNFSDSRFLSYWELF